MSKQLTKLLAKSMLPATHIGEVKGSKPPTPLPNVFLH